MPLCQITFRIYLQTLPVKLHKPLEPRTTKSFDIAHDNWCRKLHRPRAMFLELASVTPPPLLPIYAATKWIHFSLQFHFLNPDYQPLPLPCDNAPTKRGEARNFHAIGETKIERLSFPRTVVENLAQLPPKKTEKLQPRHIYPISVIRDSVADQRVISPRLFELPRDFVSFP